MLGFKSFGKAFIWLVLGCFFGLSSLLLIFASSAIFTHPIITGNIIDGNIVMYLCIALMSGAGADYSLSSSFHFGWRLSCILNNYSRTSNYIFYI